MLSSLAKYNEFVKSTHVESKKQLFARSVYRASPDSRPTSSPLRERREAGTEAGREAEREAGGEAGGRLEREAGRGAGGEADEQILKRELCETEL